MIRQRMISRIVWQWSRLDVRLVDAPLGGTEAAHNKENDGDAQVGERHAHPHFFRERVHEAEHAGELFHRLFDHDADAKVHEWLGEIHHSLACRVNCQSRHGQVGLLFFHIFNRPQ